MGVLGSWCTEVRAEGAGSQASLLLLARGFGLGSEDRASLPSYLCKQAASSVLSVQHTRPLPSMHRDSRPCPFGTTFKCGAQLSPQTASDQPYGSFQKLGVPYSGVLIIRILLFRVLY